MFGSGIIRDGTSAKTRQWEMASPSPPPSKVPLDLPPVQRPDFRGRCQAFGGKLHPTGRILPLSQYRRLPADFLPIITTGIAGGF